MTGFEKTDIMGYEEAFGYQMDVDGVWNGTNGLEMVWKCPDAMGRGHMSIIKLRPDLSLGIGNCRFTRPLSFCYDLQSAPVLIGFSLSGTMETTLNQKPASKTFRYLEKGTCTISHVPRWQGVIQYPEDVTLCAIQVLVSGSLFKTLTDARHYRVPDGIHAMVDQQEAFVFSSPLTPALTAIVSQIMECPFQGTLRQVYLEGKTLELVSLSLARLAPLKNNSKTRICPRQMKQVSLARELVRQDFKSPCSLQDLARTVGLQHTVLNKHFRTVYGTTIFAYIRELRMNQAMLLLENGRMNVTEAALEVGYSSVSHFSKAFRARFGVHPGTLVKNR